MNSVGFTAASCSSDYTETPTPRDPLEQTYLVVRNVGKYFLLPVESMSPKKQIKEELIIASDIELESETQEETTEHFPVTSEPNQPFSPRVFNFYKQSAVNISENTEETFQCDRCRSKFWNKHSLRRHIRTYCKYQCRVCERWMSSKQMLKSHMLLHNDKDSMVYKCPECEFLSNRSQNLQRHVIRMHTKFFAYKCPFCPKMYKFNGDMLRHARKHKIAKCRCDMCGKEYQNEFLLHLHRTTNDGHSCFVKEVIQLEEDHIGQPKKKRKRTKRPFKCSDCRWRFSSLDMLEKHKKRHSLCFKCDFCQVVFKYKRSFIKHMNREHRTEIESSK